MDTISVYHTLSQLECEEIDVKEAYLKIVGEFNLIIAELERCKITLMNEGFTEKSSTIIRINKAISRKVEINGNNFYCQQSVGVCGIKCKTQCEHCKK